MKIQGEGQRLGVRNKLQGTELAPPLMGGLEIMASTKRFSHRERTAGFGKKVSISV